jgi:Xaa-Pro aminopeptidase
MPDVLIFGDTRSPSLRHELPLPLPDPLAYVERNGSRYVFAGSLDVPRLRDLDGGNLEVIPLEELGLNEFLAQGKPLAEAIQEAVWRGCERVGVRDAVTPRDFPLEVADFLRSKGMTLRADGELFDDRRRARTPEQIEGIRRGLRAAEAAMAAIWDRIREGDGVEADELRALARRVFADHAALPHDMLVVSCGPQSARIHDEGEGPMEPGRPILIDIFPRDLASACWGDLTRTVCLGEPSERLQRYHADVREAQRRATEAVRPGISGGEPNRIAAQYLADQGHPTRLGAPPDRMLEEGFVHYLGHGLGLELHEAPTLDEGGETLVVGDVITIEPGVYYEDFGGVRIEDVVLVTEDGHEILTRCPYDLRL